MWLVGDLLLRVLRGGGSVILGLSQVVLLYYICLYFIFIFIFAIFAIFAILYIYIYICYCQGVMELLENARVTLVRMRPMEGSEGGSGSWAVRICFIWFYMNIYMNI